MTRLIRSAALRWALSFAGIAVAVLTAFAGVVWMGTHHRMARDLATFIEADTRALAALLAADGLPTAIEAIDAQVGHDTDEDEIVTLADASFRVLAGNLPAWPMEIRAAPGWHDVAVVRGGRTEKARVLHSVVGDGMHLIVGRGLADLIRVRALFFAGLGGAGLVIAACAVVGGLLIRRVFLDRLRAISRTAAAIVGGDLTHRLPQQGDGDELALLAQTINRMLDQIQQLVCGVRDVSNAVAHDLRTPLMELRARLEQLLIAGPSAEETTAEIEAAVADTDRVIAIFNALLRLAEIDAGVRRAGFVTVDLRDLLIEAVEFFEPLAEQKGIALTADAPVPVPVAGDPNLLAQAVGNLIDNALKYAHGSDRVRVSAGVAGRSVEIIVADNGPGIPDAEKPRVLERFYRGDGGRSSPGTGLGLSMVAAVAKLHGGSLRLADNGPGLRVVLSLPPVTPG